MISHIKEGIKREKEKYAFSYIFRRRGITPYPPYKNFVLEISIRREGGARYTRDTLNVHEEVHKDTHEEMHGDMHGVQGIYHLMIGIIGGIAHE